MTVIEVGGRLDQAREAYLQRLLAADETGAQALALGLIDAGVPAVDVLLDLVGPAQAHVGELWQTNRLNVAQEHAATHTSDRVVAAIAARTRVTPDRGRVVMACLDGEFHALPGRIVAEVLRLDGWAVTFLGASVPAVHLVSFLHQTAPDAVALSCALPLRLPAAHQTMQACQATGLPVLCGGRGFGADGRWAELLGADGWAPDARAAAAWLRRPSSRSTPPPPLDHLGDDEYPRLAHRRGELIETALAALTDRFPPLRGYTPAQLQHTVDDLGYIVDFLAAALYVDDDTLFTDFLGWLATVLDSRHVPPASVDLGLAAYHQALDGFPRARRALAAGRRTLAAWPHDAPGGPHLPHGDATGSGGGER